MYTLMTEMIKLHSNFNNLYLIPLKSLTSIVQSLHVRNINTLYGHLAIYCIICYFVYIVNIESDAIKPVSDYLCCNSCIETDDWLNFSPH